MSDINETVKTVKVINRKEVKNKAHTGFVINYWTAVGVSVLYLVIGGAISGLSSTAAFALVATGASVVLIPVIQAGTYYSFIKTYYGQKMEFESMFSGFKYFGKVLGAYWWAALWQFLWSLLLFVPGIIKGIEYSLTPFIIMEHPEYTVGHALDESKRLTKGYKAAIFKMSLSFIGWFLLDLLTGFILGIFYVHPYFHTTFAGYYEEIKNAQGEPTSGNGAYSDQGSSANEKPVDGEATIL